MKQRTYSINSKVRKEWKLRDSLSLVNDEPIPVRITKCRPMVDLRFSRSEVEGDSAVDHVTRESVFVIMSPCHRVPCLAAVLGGGALCMKTYGHLRQDHSFAQAQRVRFSIAA